MDIQAVYLGGSRGQTGCPQETISLPQAATVADAIEVICGKHPELRKHLSTARWAVNFEFASPQTILQPGDELALIPQFKAGTAGFGYRVADRFSTGHRLGHRFDHRRNGFIFGNRAKPQSRQRGRKSSLRSVCPNG